ncbi:hypothetical protein HOE37_05235 [Candidatus Woesearchaeota archaeon]|mgnify:FL=1|jgi:internalin A|nr:hypothetical protein [Candidatus Woesearchaeota archaeon]MBT4111235.1 hypothetical protein [Candidatus Woesearchaeota archaeon]MBT4336815.1 hypothetical protein [Candidatus Woesearchaeota archaeon]MBT4469483.1 hypothetical protein [Candidatus Woesearchaeota archaeon]MBT6744122.1 hypothetical protein [Candidatus Woesearchaeota archaeon]
MVRKRYKPLPPHSWEAHSGANQGEVNKTLIIAIVTIIALVALSLFLFMKQPVVGEAITADVPELGKAGIFLTENIAESGEDIIVVVSTQLEADKETLALAFTLDYGNLILKDDCPAAIENHLLADWGPELEYITCDLVDHKIHFNYSTLNFNNVKSGTFDIATITFAADPLAGNYPLIFDIFNIYDFNDPEAADLIVEGEDVFIVVEGEAQGEAITFDDPQLEAAVRGAIEKPEGDIYPADVVELTGLNANNLGIVELGGIEHLTSLETLELKYNSIVDIALLSSLTGLKSLNLYGNKNIVNIIPLSNLISLNDLNIGDNSIVDIAPLSGLTNLKDLILKYNDIINIAPLSSLTGLKSLNLYGNFKIVDISDLSDLTLLTFLSLGHNDIINIAPLSNLIGLTYLNLVNNDISDITSLSNLNQLNKLYLNGNELDGDDLTILSDYSYFSSLKSLSFGNGLVSKDLDKLSSLIGLTYLSLSGNEIVDINPLSSLTALGTLWLSNNEIVDISALSSLTALEYLYIYNNEIVNIAPLSSLTNLKNLYLYDNDITDISALSCMTKLETLKLQDNLIVEEVLPCCVRFNIDQNNQLSTLIGLDFCSQYTSADCVDVSLPVCDECQPQCGGKVCGSDGCGGSCGTCEGGNVCNTDGACVEDLGCQLNTDCAEGEACEEAECVKICTDTDPDSDPFTKGTIKWWDDEEFKTDYDGCVVGSDLALPPGEGGNVPLNPDDEPFDTEMDYILERNCLAESITPYLFYKCEFGCEEGACLPKPIAPETTEKITLTEVEPNNGIYATLITALEDFTEEITAYTVLYGEDDKVLVIKSQKVEGGMEVDNPYTVSVNYQDSEVTKKSVIVYDKLPDQGQTVSGELETPYGE